MGVLTIAFVSGIPAAYMPESLNAETSHAYHAQVSFVSGFVGLLTDLFMRRGFSPLHKRIASAFSPSHDSPSNDRFSPHADFSARKTIL